MQNTIQFAATLCSQAAQVSAACQYAMVCASFGLECELFIDMAWLSQSEFSEQDLSEFGVKTKPLAAFAEQNLSAYQHLKVY